MGNCFSCCRRENYHFDDGVPKCEQASSVTLVKEKNTFVGKDGEGETTSRAENKCQLKTELEKSISGIQKAENQETAKVIQDNLDKEKSVQDDLDTQKDVEDNFDRCKTSNGELVQTEVKENSSSEETEEVDVANVVAKSEVDDGIEKMSQLHEEDFEIKSQPEESDSSAETNIVGESAFDREIEDQPQETGLANEAEKMNELNEEDLERKSQSEIPFEKSYSSSEINIAGESAVDEQVENMQQREIKLARENVQRCSRNAEFDNEDVLVDGEIVVTITKGESQDEVEDNIAAEGVRIEENVGETTIDMSASAANSSGQDNNAVEIEKELGQASSAEENVPNEQKKTYN